MILKKVKWMDLVGKTIKDLEHGHEATVISFDPHTKMVRLVGRYPGGLSDDWLTPWLATDYGIVIDWTEEELKKIEECLAVSRIERLSRELREAIAEWLNGKRSKEA